MNPLALTLTVISALALLSLPRRWAFVPLLAGASYITLGQVIEVGSLSFTVTRILVLVGFLRVVVRGERLPGGIHALDVLMVLWAVCMCVTSAFHEDASTEVISRLGYAYDACGVYFILRVCCVSFEDVARLCAATTLILAPVALAMVYEHLAFHNLFSVFGGVPETPMVREGRIRAFGPFTHPILAGTVGAVTLPLAVGLWPQRRVMAFAGTVCCLLIVVTSSSSGPIMSAAAVVAAFCAWPHRHRMRQLRWLAVAMYIALELVMRDPAYYIIARLDVIGGSTGWHRAALIDAAVQHIGEWWLGGTDYTRHWMPTGVSWNANHTDITNHYLKMGVLGGLPLMLLFIAMLAKAFAFVGSALKHPAVTTHERRFLTWALGCGLFGQAATCISVSYFDQSVTFLYVTLAAIGASWACCHAAVAVAAPTNAVSSTPVRDSRRHFALNPDYRPRRLPAGHGTTRSVIR